MLTKHQTHMKHEQTRIASGIVLFRTRDDDTERILESHHLSIEDWNDMGRPTEITVEVRPGNVPFHD